MFLFMINYKKINMSMQNKGKKEFKIKKVKEECSVCCEIYSSDKRKKIECPKCNFSCCKKCMEKYLMENDKDIPTCMQCNLEFSNSFMIENTSKSFFGDRFINKRAIHTLNDQKNLLPGTLLIMNRRKEIKQRQIEIINKQREHNRALAILKDESYQLTRELNLLPSSNNNEDRMHKPCPVNECKGYLSTAKSGRPFGSTDCIGRPFGSTAWKCGVCETWVCPDCGNIKGGKNDEEHVCNEDDKITLVMLKKDTKQCPGCYKPIHKIEGCDQMFCVECHTAFSWITGKKVSGKIHNPHYYEMQRAANGGIAPRVEGDNPCGIIEDEYPQLYLIRNAIRHHTATYNYSTHLTDIEKIHRAFIHNDDTLLHIVNVNTTNDLYTTYREKYLNGGYDEKKWTSDIKKSIKKTEKNKQAKMIYDLVKTISIDIFNRFINLQIEEYNCLIELYNVKEYANTELKKIYDNYKTKVLMYKDDYTLGAGLD